MGDYKLVEFFESGELELYNLREDVSESRDLAKECPERRAVMHERLRAWRASVEAKVPEMNDAYEPWDLRPLC